MAGDRADPVEIHSRFRPRTVSRQPSSWHCGRRVQSEADIQPFKLWQPESVAIPCGTACARGRTVIERFPEGPARRVPEAVQERSLSRLADFAAVRSQLDMADQVHGTPRAGAGDVQKPVLFEPAFFAFG